MPPLLCSSTGSSDTQRPWARRLLTERHDTRSPIIFQHSQPCGKGSAAPNNHKPCLHRKEVPPPPSHIKFNCHFHKTYSHPTQKLFYLGLRISSSDNIANNAKHGSEKHSISCLVKQTCQFCEHTSGKHQFNAVVWAICDVTQCPTDVSFDLETSM